MKKRVKNGIETKPSTKRSEERQRTKSPYGGKKKKDRNHCVGLKWIAIAIHKKKAQSGGFGNTIEASGFRIEASGARIRGFGVKIRGRVE